MSGELGSALSDEWGIYPFLHLSMMGLTFLYSTVAPTPQLSLITVNVVNDIFHQLLFENLSDRQAS